MGLHNAHTYQYVIGWMNEYLAWRWLMIRRNMQPVFVIKKQVLVVLDILLPLLKTNFSPTPIRHSATDTKKLVWFLSAHRSATFQL
jgi:hypothetical protein